MFSGCYALSMFSAPKYAKEIFGWMFYYCYNLKECNVPLANAISFNAFAGCSKLQSLSFMSLSTIASSAFIKCSSLESVYLLYSSLCKLAAANAFYYTPMFHSSYLGHYGSIFVPASLVDAYKSATNWAVYADRITAYVEP